MTTEPKAEGVEAVTEGRQDNHVPQDECPICKEWAHKFGPCGYHARNPTPSAVEALARAVEGVMPHSYERGVATTYVGRGWTQLSAALAHPEIAPLLKETK